MEWQALPWMRGSTTGHNRKAALLLAVGGALFGAMVILAWARRGLYGHGDLALFGGASLFFLVLGSLILWRVPGNRMGWLYGLIGLSISAAGVGGVFADGGVVQFHAIGSSFWMSWIAAVPLLILWYPTGRVATRRWLWVQAATYALIAGAFLGTNFAETICLDQQDAGCARSVDNPVGIPGVPVPETWEPTGIALAILMFLAVASLVIRYRRAGTVERLQLKWFLFGAWFFVAAIAIEIAFETVTGEPPPAWLDAVFSIALLWIPIASTMAILRYRLYDIERVISRTVSYTLVVGVLAGLVALLAAVVGTRFEDPPVVAATTLVVAASFNPIRRRVQRAVDRRFNRSRFDAGLVMDGFARTLKDRVDSDFVVAGWVGVVEQTMQPATTTVWVKS